MRRHRDLSNQVLQLNDNDLIIDYTGASPITTIEGKVASAYNVVGDWAGNGITSGVAAVDGNFTLAVADNAQLAAPFGTSQGGQGCVTGLMLLLAMAVQGVLLAPVAIAAGLCASFAPAALLVVAPACAVYGGLLWWAGLGVAVRWAWWRQAEILEAITPA